MKKLLLSIAFLGASALVNAQAPTFQWAGNFGGLSYDQTTFGLVDKAGNSYSIGYFAKSGDFDPGPAVFTLDTVKSISDNFVVKLDADGKFAWAKCISGASCMAIDNAGNLNFVGSFKGAMDFDLGTGVVNRTALGNGDLYILKMDANGNYIDVRTIGDAAGSVIPSSVSIDGSNNIVVTGSFSNSFDFDASASTASLSATNGNTFILKLDGSRNFVWAKNIGGVNSESRFVVTDPAGSVYLSGWYRNMGDFNPDAGIATLFSKGYEDIFVVKLTASGSFAWAKSAGGKNEDHVNGMTIDDKRNIYLSGDFGDSIDFEAGNPSASHFIMGGTDAYIWKMDSLGNHLMSKIFGGTLYERGYGIKVDGAGNIYTTGVYNGKADFDPGAGTYYLTPVKANEIFVSKLNNLGNFVWAVSVGYKYNEYARGIGIDDASNVYVFGHMWDSCEFDPGPANYFLTPNGDVDAFVFKLAQSGTSILEASTMQNISLYPNPNTGIVTIKNPNANNTTTLEIFNVVGSKVYHQKSAETFTIIDLAGQASGVYFVKIIQDGQLLSTQKIVKQ